jgi:hypothetical protein
MAMVRVPRRTLSFTLMDSPKDLHHRGAIDHRPLNCRLFCRTDVATES